MAVLSDKREMRFMDITRHLGINDHTKVNFHLKNLKANGFVSQDREKRYKLTIPGKKIIDRLRLLTKNISS